MNQEGKKLLRKLAALFTVACILMMAIPGVYAQGTESALTVPFGGTVDEWSEVEYNEALSGNDLTYFKATQKSGILYLCVKGEVIKGNTVFYIDSDNNGSTGKDISSIWKNGSGIDYKIVGDILYKYENGDWKESGNIIIAKSDTVLESSVDVSLLELDGSSKIKVAFSMDGNNYLPEPSKDMLTVEGSLDFAAAPNFELDGRDTEWGELLPIAQGQGAVKDLYAYRSEDKLHVMAHVYASVADTMNIYINTDNDPETGYQNWGQFSSAGGDYLIQASTLFKSNGAGWDWTQVSTGDVLTVASPEPDRDGYYTVEVEVELSDMEDISQTLKLAFEIENLGYAPKIWSSLGYATAISLSSSDSFIVDGDDSEWIKIDTIANSSLVDNELYVVQDYTRLFTLVKGDSLNTQNVYYIDSDNNDQTGFTHPYWGNSGIDYKVDKGQLYRFSGTQENPVWEKAGMVHMNVYDSYVEMYLNLSQIGLSQPSTLKIGYVGKNTVVLPEKGSEMVAVDKVVNWQKMQDTFYPSESYEILNNPFMGWVPWCKDSNFELNEEYPQPHSMVYAGITWREIEPVKGVYNWEEIEEKYQFDFWANKGKRFNLRLVLDYPTSDPNHMDIPDWLYDELVAEGEPGVWYEADGVGKGFSPNYNSPLLIGYHEKLIEEFAERYDNDPRIAFIQLGSLGHWAEWHNWPEDKSGPFPKLNVSDQYVQHYLDNFSNKLIGMRKPFPIASKNNLGLFNDMFGEKGSTDSWLEWTRTGWNEIYLYINEGQDPLEVQAASAMSDFWKYSFSGGEFYNGDASISLTDDRIMESLREARESHTSWLGPCSPAKYDIGCDIQENIDILLKTIGYRFVIESVTHASQANSGDKLNVSMNWINKGVAPFYYDWPIELSIVDSNNKIVSKYVLEDVKIPQLLPGRTVVESEIELPNDMKSGTYTLCVAIIDPDTGEPGVELGINGKRPDGRYELDTISIDGGSRGGSGGTGSVSDPSGPSSSNVSFIVDGKTIIGGIQTIGIAADGRTMKTVEILPSLIGAILEDASNNSTMVIPISGTQDINTGILTGKMIKDLESKNAIIEIKTDKVTYSIPSQEISIDDISALLGANINLADVDIEISVNKATDDEIQAFQKAAEEGKFSLVVSPVEFYIKAAYDGKTIDIDSFDNYVSRLIEIPSDIDSEQVTTGVVLNPNGTVRHVPTQIVSIDGKYYAKINSMTNSTYSVIMNSVQFSDISNSFAEDAINDLGSRMIVFGVGEGRYDLNSELTRGQFAAIIVRALGLSEGTGEQVFNDVRTSNLFYGSIESASKHGIIYGYGDGNFGPNDKITREQAMCILERAMNLTGLKVEFEADEAEILLKTFNDSANIANYAEVGIASCVKSGIVAGKANKMLAPKDNVTRAEVAVIVRNLMLKSDLI